MIAQFPHLAMKNSNLLKNSTKAGCYHCCKIFNATEIKDFTDEKETCICPYCQNDTIVGDTCGFTLTEEILIRAKQFWFKHI